MLQISADITSLTQAQLEKLAGFLVTFHDLTVVEEEGSTLSCVSFPNISDEEETLDFSAPLPAGVEFAESFNPAPLAVGTGKTIVIPTGGPSQVDPPSNLDKNGLPWDDRIHASSKAKNADGSWRYKRGVESRLVDQVQAELKALMGLPAPKLLITPAEAAAFVAERAATSITPLPAIQPNPETNNRPVVPFPPPAVPAAAAVPSITASPVVSAPTVAALNPFVSLITFAGAKNMEGKLTDAEIQAACAAVGVPAIPLMTNRHDLCPHVEASLRLLCSTR